MSMTHHHHPLRHDDKEFASDGNGRLSVHNTNKRVARATTGSPPNPLRIHTTGTELCYYVSTNVVLDPY
ncbi:hypothetical protein DAPPUDRAFT_233873 [Daphnia pulex]|uniref:Uncharacterized protein n=1 Tax=Daphnia pulex TaxID=6669 RepID=E9FVZ6_DAPPU|nr:hypothetical protein DAPPUDRAFT_233873 [Daphnia pulex]|eukprot:EFX89015.1 hypothetical protein DAPPUDRAFT_233873 [Daphnia pulex]